jgi:hypothetical protein
LDHGRNAVAGEDAPEALFIGPASVWVPSARVQAVVRAPVKEQEAIHRKESARADLRRNEVADDVAPRSPVQWSSCRLGSASATTDNGIRNAESQSFSAFLN